MAQAVTQQGLTWWQVVLLFGAVPALAFAVIALTVYLPGRHRPPAGFPRLAAGAVQANGDSRQPTGADNRGDQADLRVGGAQATPPPASPQGRPDGEDPRTA